MDSDNIIFNNKEILFMDFSGIESSNIFIEQLVDVEQKLKDLIVRKKKVLIFTDISGTFVDTKSFNRLKELAILGKPVVLKSAVLGITGAKKTLLNIVNMVTGMPSKVFTEKQEALEWLTK